jgi:hypothetical protein
MLQKVINNLSKVLIIVNDFSARIELKIMMRNILMKMDVYSLTQWS